MATSRPLKWISRTLVVVAASALSLTVLPGTTGPASAAPNTPPPLNLPTPRTPQEAQKQITQLNEQLEIVTEDFNQASQDLIDQRAAEARAKVAMGQVDGRMQALSGKVRQMAASVYRSAPISEFGSLMTSDSPDEFLAQMSGLDILGQRRSTTLTALRTAKGQADEARIAAQRAAAQTQATLGSLKSKKTWIEQQLPKQQALLASLSADQRSEIFGGDSGSWPDLPPPSGKAAVALAAAKSKLGAPYVWGAEGPSSFDCSGLTLWAWGQAGVGLPRNSAAQMGVGVPVPRDQLAPGDLVFFYSPVHHVGMYVGDGMMVHAPSPGDVVKVSSMSTMPYTGARRLG